MDGSTVSVERVIKAPPERVFALLADAARHASFDGSESVNHASQQSVPLSMGSTFAMAMKGRKETLFIPYRTTNTVIEYEPDRRIAWQTFGLGGLVGGRIWRYELLPAEGGTLVRETWDVSRDKQKRMITSGSMPKLTAAGMRATLARIADLLES
ncbi:dimethyladenosine transferase [Mycobacterium sp. 852002-50816_SCH5313054-b]|uniref:SRPBCC family protein n=1 Tax=Mycobacterium sp. 852002-50816_SCH5313054-b TaxID=1834092 RepID=UPI0007FBF98D|nr:SRPBCC family protein [Mycobacterium sp. 852002-50816_SCH5313054-b]OBF60793.1 dimethyladenosine transferase [Mycobacterium sp. 852002-50816_SCH5313054-b]